MVAAVVSQYSLGPVLALLGAVRRPLRNIMNPVEDAAAASSKVTSRVGGRVPSLMSLRLLDESGGLALGVRRELVGVGLLGGLGAVPVWEW